ncbi:MAG: GTP 3',8-cyclase MoaA [Gemmatimonadetes bacterium]|jgi:GTP 3',8-cyclase|nr:GTP 3',8-cyclase MoaA [Gemmatimonadota bacterium]MBT6147057.1 GTP 3',8-cyclase MoaA [Gemmatimonadota bacterium]MBT7863831.1 GTP 3',8-cyclase MoaA [Gemmatimonadota bacterium]
MPSQTSSDPAGDDLPDSARPSLDALGRPLRSLRVSVIDRCDLRCAYCMPEEDYAWLPKEGILTFDEILRLVDGFVEQGVRRVRLTGGEPLLRGGLVDLVRDLSIRHGVEDLAITTNATQLARWAQPLRDAGLHRVTVSLDSLKPGRFETLTRRAALEDVLAGIRAASEVGFDQLKINTVVMRDFNDDEVADLARFAQEVGAQARFIEYMDVGGATLWSPERVVTRDDILSLLQEALGEATPEASRGAAPAESFTLANGARVGVIASTTQPFCSNCDRSRLTADGHWYLCLYAEHGIDLRAMLRDGATADEVSEQIRSVWSQREDRGAEERLEMPERGALYQIQELRQDPRREMHTRGG